MAAQDQEAVIPPPPPGFKLREQETTGTDGIPPPPPGFKLRPQNLVKQTPAEGDTKPFVESTYKPYDFTGLRKAAIPAITGAGGALIGGALGGGLPGGALGAQIGGTLGESIEQGIERFRGEPDAPKSTQEFLDRSAKEGLVQGGMELAGGIVTRGLGKAAERYLNPERIYQSGLKPTGVRQGDALKHVQTGIKEKIPLEAESRGLVGDKIDQLGRAVERVINTPILGTSRIKQATPYKNIADRLDVLRKQWSKDAINGPEFVDQINEMERSFLLNHGQVKPIVKVVKVPGEPSGLFDPRGNPIMGPEKTKMITIEPTEMSLQQLRDNAQPISALEAQKIKQQTYETIRTANRTAWESKQHPGLTIRARKELSKGIKEELERLYPEIKGLNARQGALIGLEEQLDRFVKREGNRQLTSYGMFGMAGAAIAGHEGMNWEAGAAAGMILRRALEDPHVKSWIALALDEAGKKPALRTASKVAGKINLPAQALRVGRYELDKNEKGLNPNP